jgi:hypothetical protein
VDHLEANVYISRRCPFCNQLWKTTDVTEYYLEKNEPWVDQFWQLMTWVCFIWKLQIFRFLFRIVFMLFVFSAQLQQNAQFVVFQYTMVKRTKYTVKEIFEFHETHRPRGLFRTRLPPERGSSKLAVWF